MDEVIALSNVTVRSDERMIFDGLDFSVPKGSLRVMLGAGGSGKTTLFRLLTAEILPANGTVRVAGESVDSLHGARRARFRRSIGVVFQEVPLVSDRNVEAQILLPLELVGMDRARRCEALEKILDRFELQAVREFYPDTLPMGMRQRVAIARAVAAEPLVLLADEPTAHLDLAAQQEIARIFQRENLRGMTILIGTSNEHFASCFPTASVQTFPPPSKVT